MASQLIEPQTDRLLLRQWRPGDRPLFAAMNSDPEVMRYFPAALSRIESDALADRLQRLIEERGWGFWAVEHKAERRFIGFVGLHTTDPLLPFTPCMEMGWRLSRAHWGKGYATEAARAALAVAFEQLAEEQVIAFTAVQNRPSQAVMERLAMQRDKNTFEHPKVAASSGLRQHCLYRISRKQWLSHTGRHSHEN